LRRDDDYLGLWLEYVALPAALLSFLAMTSLLIYRGQRNRIAAGAVN
jgi:hypothetical protein